jgi:hypothetical protein
VGVVQSYFPGVDLQRLVADNPKPLLKSKVALEEDLLNVRNMLAEAANPDALVATLPILLEPKVMVSCLVTIQRWFPKKDPLKVRHPRASPCSTFRVVQDEQGSRAYPYDAAILSWTSCPGVYVYKTSQRCHDGRRQTWNHVPCLRARERAKRTGKSWLSSTPPAFMCSRLTRNVNTFHA